MKLFKKIIQAASHTFCGRFLLMFFADRRVCESLAVQILMFYPGSTNVDVWRLVDWAYSVSGDNWSIASTLLRNAYGRAVIDGLEQELPDDPVDLIEEK